jgi:hypothetical protein
MKEGLFNFVYFTFLHNSEVFGYALASLTALLMLLKKPSRRMVFFFVGFLLLVFHFEYQKHIVAGLAEQTVDTIFIEEGNYRARWLTSVGIYHLLPLLAWIGGWGGVLLGILDWQKWRGWWKKIKERVRMGH